MKKAIYVLGIIVVLITLSYIYYESKETEVYLTGKVVGFVLESKQNSTIYTGKQVYTSSEAIGTMTFIKENGEFSAVGHTLTGQNRNSEGECYGVDFLKIQKSRESNVGRIVASIDNESKLGYVSKDSNYGVFGTVENISIARYKKIRTENRYNIRKDTAYVLIDLDGKGIKQYEIEITGINYLAFAKNINITVTSQELINKTGGIVQGMSGAPIVQNGKLIGAINSADIQNPLCGYGIFIDKLI